MDTLVLVLLGLVGVAFLAFAPAIYVSEKRVQAVLERFEWSRGVVAARKAGEKLAKEMGRETAEDLKKQTAAPLKEDIDTARGIALRAAAKTAEAKARLKRSANFIDCKKCGVLRFHATRSDGSLTCLVCKTVKSLEEVSEDVSKEVSEDVSEDVV